MHDHLIFGERLRSDVGFPELPRFPGGPARWTLRVHGDRARPARACLIGETTVSGGPVRLYRADGSWWLDYHDTGAFAVSADGAEIGWCPAPDADVALARLDVIGRVLALSLHAAGLLVLHGSAVATDDGVIAFLAPKFHGKSTLAAALVGAGAALVTDDTLAVTPGQPPTALPGVHHVRLWPDSAARLAAGTLAAQATPEAASANGLSKHRLDRLPGDRLTRAPLPLAAVYLVAPVAASGAAPACRVPIAPMRAALALVTHAKLGDVLGGVEAAALLDRAA
ncbi:MAG TPA: hypothetical protein VNA89_15245, partial [Gemmatimonadaceae bacterium]|nr:hypothetical protein [Gemmatimonadaceae bacterium]